MQCESSHPLLRAERVRYELKETDDPVYTGKAMAGLIDLVRTGVFTARQTVVFIHTGGTSGLFGYRDGLAEDVR